MTKDIELEYIKKIKNPILKWVAMTTKFRQKEILVGLLILEYNDVGVGKIIDLIIGAIK